MLDKSGEGLQLEGATGLLEVKKKPKRVRIGMGTRSNVYVSGRCVNFGSEIEIF